MIIFIQNPSTTSSFTMLILQDRQLRKRFFPLSLVLLFIVYTLTTGFFLTNTIVFFYSYSLFVFFCSHDCGFFMLQILDSYDGESMCLFSQKDILNIRMTMLYSWLTGGDFNIDLKDVLGVDPGMIFTFSQNMSLAMLYNTCFFLDCSVL